MQGLLLAAVLEGPGIWRIIGGGGLLHQALTNLGNGGTLLYLTGRLLFLLCVSVLVCHLEGLCVGTPGGGVSSFN